MQGGEHKRALRRKMAGKGRGTRGHFCNSVWVLYGKFLSPVMRVSLLVAPGRGHGVGFKTIEFFGECLLFGR